MIELLPGPLLVVAAVAGPDLDRGAFGRGPRGHAETEPRLAANDGAVSVEVPLLVPSPTAVPDLHPGARLRGMVRYAEALVAVDLQLTVGQVGPLLVPSPIAVPDVELRAVGRGPRRGTLRQRLEPTPRSTPVVLPPPPWVGRTSSVIEFAG